MAKHLVICGHGQGPRGYDPGATGTYGTETDWVRKIAHTMKRYSGDVIDYVIDRNVFEYRNMNQYKGYDSITELHLNAFNTQARGCEVLIWKGFKADNLDNKLLSILAKYFINRGIKLRDNLYNMQVSAQCGFNYRLVEVCFVDNVNDMQILTDNLDTIAKQFVEAITNKPVQNVTQPKNNAPQAFVERKGTRTPDTVTGALKPLVEGEFVEVRQQATHYENGKPINPIINGGKYKITGVRMIDTPYSKRAYRLEKDGTAIGWLYEHDIVEAYQKTEQKPPKETTEIFLGGKKYVIMEK